ncbi:MAG: ATP-dependent RecD-like DNA helicase [Monoglobales bacterium]
MILCNYEQRIYQNQANGYTVAVYGTTEHNKIPASAIRQSDGHMVCFSAVGTELPCLEEAEIELEGIWEESKQYGRQLKVEWFRVRLPKSKEGIIAYLSSDMIKGIGPVLANAIVKKFGLNTFHVLDQTPEKLLDIKGITKTKLESIMESYRASSEIRELMTFLAPYHVTPKKAERIKEAFGLEAVGILKKEPYRLCEIPGFGFLTVDPVARASNQLSPDAPMRVQAATSYILKEAEKEGHLYLDSKEIIDRVQILLNKGFRPGTVGKNCIIRMGNEMVLKTGKLESDGTAVYLPKNRRAEIRAAKHVLRIMNAPGKVYGIEQELEEVQAECGMILAEQQKEAVRMVFGSQFSIITGGPGKGKTTILKIILKIFERKERGSQVLLCAPTGRARKRLAESCGYPALTIHKALYLKEDDGDETLEDGSLEEDFIIADEFTMADMHLASILFAKIKSGARVVLVGDVDQLPSVGPGNVFKELICSGVIPVTVLDVFFRQDKDSRIILNADKMNRNQKQLLYGDDFQFHKAEKADEASLLIADIYEKELKKAGGNVGAVQVLSPYRSKTGAGVNALNKQLREIANPFSMNLAEWKIGNTLYRVGDKVMQTKNTEEVSNGDIGRVQEIRRRKDGERELVAVFGEVVKTYLEEELSVLDLAYASSIHKSQGGEFSVVILPILECFYPMLKRNVYYTGITRARKRVHLVGTKKALAMAIANTDEGKRNTMLARRIRDEAKMQNHGSIAAAA